MGHRDHDPPTAWDLPSEAGGQRQSRGTWPHRGDGPAPDRGRRAPPAGLLERRAFLLVAAPGVTGPAAFQPGLPCTCLSLCSPGAIVPDELGGLDKTG